MNWLYSLHVQRLTKHIWTIQSKEWGAAVGDFTNAPQSKPALWKPVCNTSQPAAIGRANRSNKIRVDLSLGVVVSQINVNVPLSPLSV